MKNYKNTIYALLIAATTIGSLDSCYYKPIINNTNSNNTTEITTDDHSKTKNNSKHKYDIFTKIKENNKYKSPSRNTDNKPAYKTPTKSTKNDNSNSNNSSKSEGNSDLEKQIIELSNKLTATQEQLNRIEAQNKSYNAQQHNTQSDQPQKGRRTLIVTDIGVFGSYGGRIHGNGGQINSIQYNLDGSTRLSSRPSKFQRSQDNLRRAYGL